MRGTAEFRRELMSSSSALAMGFGYAVRRALASSERRHVFFNWLPEGADKAKIVFVMALKDHAAATLVTHSLRDMPEGLTFRHVDEDVRVPSMLAFPADMEQVVS